MDSETELIKFTDSTKMSGVVDMLKGNGCHPDRPRQAWGGSEQTALMWFAQLYEMHALDQVQGQDSLGKDNHE